MKIKLSILYFFFQIYFSFWSNGHFIVANIAKTQLEKYPKVIDKIQQMLKPLCKYFNENCENFIESAIAPDSIMNQYDLLFMFFHFTNKPIVYENDNNNSQFKENNIYNVKYAMQIATRIIQESLKNETKIIKKGFLDSLMLRYLIHIVGDIHQPLHCSQFYSKYKYDGKIKDGDQGGNLIPVYDIFNKGIDNLHKLWDSGIGLYSENMKLPLTQENFQKIQKQTNELIKKFPKEHFNENEQNLNYQDWIDESYYIAKILYTDIDIFPLLRTEYIMKSQQVVQERLTLAGYRLGNYLLFLFKQLNQKKKFQNIQSY